MCTGQSFDPGRAVTAAGTGGLSELYRIAKPKTEKVSVSQSGLYGSNLTGAGVNDADNPNAAGASRNLGTDKASLADRVKNSVGASTMSGSILGIDGQGTNKKYVLAGGSTVQGAKRVI